MGVSAPVVCLQDVLSNSLSDGNLQLDDQHVSADRLQSAAVGEVESAGESSGKTRPRIGGCSCSWVAALLAKLPSVHGHGLLLSTPSRIPIDTAAPICIGRTVYPTDRPTCDWAADDITPSMGHTLTFSSNVGGGRQIHKVPES